MNRYLVIIFQCLIGLASTRSIAASKPVTIRYALVIGSNVGADPAGETRSGRLRHAEQEAARMRDALWERCNFDRSATRTRLLTGATTADVKAAFRALTLQKERDEEMFGTVDSFFFFYFSGHGLPGSLLLRDGPLSNDDIVTLFNTFNATFSVSVFDSCFSGSLDRSVLAKSIRVSDTKQLFERLPKEVLNAKGSVWYVSSQLTEESYEDKTLGSVFTHFFLEALQQAEPNGPGISLDRIWEYVYEKTVDYTARNMVRQTPERFASNFRSTAPIYFSFPHKRSATLTLADDLFGTFVLAYPEGGHTEIFEKQAGAETSYAVYPGRAYLIPLAARNLRREIALTAHEVLTLSARSLPRLQPALGERLNRFTLLKKSRAHSPLVVTEVEPGLSVVLGVGYSFSAAPESLLQTRHGIILPLRFDYHWAMLRIEGLFGIDKNTYPAWSYRLLKGGGKLSGGAGFNQTWCRWDVALSFSLYTLRQKFENDDERRGMQYGPGLEVGLLVPNRARAMTRLFLNGSLLSSPGIGIKSDPLWQTSVTVGASVSLRLY